MHKVNCAFKPFSAASPHLFGAAWAAGEGVMQPPLYTCGYQQTVCLPSTEKSSSVTTLSVASASCLDFFFFPQDYRWGSVVGTAQGVTLCMDPWRAGSLSTAADR